MFMALVLLSRTGVGRTMALLHTRMPVAAMHFGTTQRRRRPRLRRRRQLLTPVLHGLRGWRMRRAAL